jgi:hypothetical protein
VALNCRFQSTSPLTYDWAGALLASAPRARANTRRSSLRRRPGIHLTQNDPVTAPHFNVDLQTGQGIQSMWSLVARGWPAEDPWPPRRLHQTDTGVSALRCDVSAGMGTKRFFRLVSKSRSSISTFLCTGGVGRCRIAAHCLLARLLPR